MKLSLVQILDIILRDQEQARVSLADEVTAGRLQIDPRHLDESIPEYFASKQSYTECLHRLLEKIENKDDSETCRILKKYLVELIQYLEEYSY